MLEQSGFVSETTFIDLKAERFILYYLLKTNLIIETITKYVFIFYLYKIKGYLYHVSIKWVSMSSL